MLLCNSPERLAWRQSVCACGSVCECMRVGGCVCMSEGGQCVLLHQGQEAVCGGQEMHAEAVAQIRMRDCSIIHTHLAPPQTPLGHAGAIQTCLHTLHLFENSKSVKMT